MKKIFNFINHLGPGILLASAAIGTSHLIQSTRAGAYFGLELLWVIVIINCFKYPFIEYGFRYASATGNNLLYGYKQLSTYYLIFFLITNIISAIGGVALLAYLTAGIAKSVLGSQLDINTLSMIILILTTILITLENYDFLDNIMKVFMVILFFSTLFTTIAAINNYTPDPGNIVYQTSAWSKSSLPFVIALMGWMPGPIELGVWYSLWLQAKNRGDHKLNFESAKIDFNFGYVLMILTAVFFNILGAIVLRHSGTIISNNASEFASQLVSVYTSVIGKWSEVLIGSAMLTTIFSTTISVIDIYPRSISVSIQTLMNTTYIVEKRQRFFLTIGISLLAYLIIHFAVTDFRVIADVVTSISFIFAPFFAFLNYKVVTSTLLEKSFHPGRFLRVLSLIGFVFILAFVFVFIYLEVFLY